MSNQIDTSKVKRLASRLDEAREQLVKAREALAACHLGRHQETISVSVGDNRVQVTSIGGPSDNYAAVLNRGCEMILLGVKKLLASNVAHHEQQVVRIEAELSDAVLGKGAGDE